MMDVIMLAIGLGFFVLSVATATPAIDSRRRVMTFDYSLAAVVSLGLLIYLAYALLRPEQF